VSYMEVRGTLFFIDRVSYMEVRGLTQYPES